jgi:hypothetical protein
MHQASILFTAAVMAMAGAWYVMQDMSRADVELAASRQQAASDAPAAMLVQQVDYATE